MSIEMERVEALQNQCHDVVEAIMKQTNVSYQDATNVFLFIKISELEEEIKLLKKQLH